jgi:phage gp29-like protein
MTNITSKSSLAIPSRDGVSPVVDINPGIIRSTIEGGFNVELQDMIETLICADAHFAGQIADRLSVIRKASFNFTPASQDPKDVEICDFVKSNLEKVLSKTILKHMLNAVFTRFSVTEIMWEFRQNKYWIKELKALPPRAFEFNKRLQDYDKEELHLLIYDYDNDIASEIPENKTVITYAPTRFEDKVVSVTEIIAIYIVIKYYALQKDWTRFNELFGVPMLLGLLGQNASNKERDDVLEALMMLGSNSVGVLRGLSKIDVIQPNSNDPAPFLKIIDTCNAEISKAISGQSGTSEDGHSSSYASLDILNGVREDIAQDSLDLIADAVNEQLIKPLVDFNFDVEEYPVFELELPANITKLLEIDSKLNNIGVRFTKDYFLERYNLRETDFDIIKQQENLPLFNSLEQEYKKKTLKLQTASPNHKNRFF